MRTHASKSVSLCFAALRQIRSIRRTTTRSVLKSLVVALVLSRLDYGGATLAGLPGTLLSRLQSALNAAARLIFKARKFDHVTPLCGISTGFVSQNAWTSGLQCLSTGAYTALRQHTCPASCAA